MKQVYTLNRRFSTFGLTAVTGVVVILLSACGARGNAVSMVQAQTPTSAHTGSAATPTYLPPGSTFEQSWTVGATTVSYWQLPGAINADNEAGKHDPSSLATLMGNPDAHAASGIYFYATPTGQTAPFVVPESDTYTTRRATTVDGWPAYVQAPKSGYGAFSVHWSTPSYEYVVECLRAQIGPNQANGVDVATLQKIASSAQ